MSERDPDFYSPQFDDSYFSLSGPWGENREVFLKGNRLPELFARRGVARGRAQIQVGELGFGTGLQFAMTARAWAQATREDSSAWLHFISVEKFPLAPAHRLRVLDKLRDWGLREGVPPAEVEETLAYLEDFGRWAEPLIEGWHSWTWERSRVRLHLGVGDALERLQELGSDQRIAVSAWALHGFSPAKNPELWSEALFREVARLSESQARVASFSVAGSVRAALTATGFEVSRVEGVPPKRSRLEGVRSPAKPAAASREPWFAWPASTRAALPTPEIRVQGAGLSGAWIARAFADRGCRVRIHTDGSDRGASQVPRAMAVPRLSRVPNYRSRLQLAGFARLHQLAAKMELDSQEWSPVRGMPKDLATLQQVEPELLTAPRAVPERLRELDWVRMLPEGIEWRTLRPAQPRALVEAALDHPKVQRMHGSPEGETQAAVRIHAGGALQTREGTDPCRGILGSAPPSVPSTSAGGPFHVVLGSASLIRESDRSWVGSTYEWSKPDLALGPEDHRYFEDEILRPAGLDAAQGWTPEFVAHRMMTRDGLPLCGPRIDTQRAERVYADLHRGFDPRTLSLLPSIPDEYELGGLGSHGLLLAPWLADVLAAIVLGEPILVPRVLLNAVHSSRFQVRRLKRPPSPPSS